ncbi:MAG: 2-polyprenyl-3-methyl-6-methoxy-1,4-benzoquinone monooxygenase [Neisseriaceae bacterium]|jgi:ubiquinone biosynthesis monooxygenase Coq7
MLDNLIIEFDKALKTLFSEPVSVRTHPDSLIEESDLSESDKKHAISLMRVNHCGEVCAQALYQGQAITTSDKSTKIAFKKAADEETEHLAWTKHRITELGGRTSILNPLFYFGSLTIGITAGIMGDKWNLGFLEETERQVEAHLESHLDKINPEDSKSMAILQQMKEDEIKHAEMAHNYGAAQLPRPIKLLMTAFSKIMTKTTYYI